MRIPFSFVLLALFSSGLCLATEPRPPSEGYVIDHRHSPHVQLRPLPYDAVKWTKGFWADRFQQTATVTLDESWRLLADPKAGHVLDNFRFAAKPGTGRYAGTSWQDEWLYKWIEAASCIWRDTRNPVITARINEAIGLIAAAQEADGYLATRSTAGSLGRFLDPRDHEFYNMGHLLTAAVVHHRMTGDDRLLKVAIKTADFMVATLGVTVKPYFAHNPSAIMGLIELYRDTGDRRYLATAELIVDRRGESPKKQTLFTMIPGIGGTDIIQDRVPVRESSEIVGHNVFFTYLYTGAGDVYAETGDPKLMAALERLWHDMTERKMFIHGGVSAEPMGVSNFAPVIEAAGPAYDLPNAGCYNETCGQIGCLMWGYRMLTETPDSRFADIIEREMYNGFLGAESLDGKAWFYRNIIRRYDEDHKASGVNDMVLRTQPGRKSICCPSNLLRTIAELSSYFYNLDDRGVWIHHYGGSKVNVNLLSGQPFAFEQLTDYPWSGDVRIVIGEAPPAAVDLRLRIPGWSSGAVLSVNGKTEELRMSHGYASVERVWRAGDTLRLVLPMPTQLIAADPRVEATRNQVAVMRGPVVYCIESKDLPEGVKVPEVYLSQQGSFKPVVGLAHADAPLSASVVCLRGEGLRLAGKNWQTLYRPLGSLELRPFEVTLIPYFAWANRGRSAMSVWLPVILETRR
ncbi:MAG: glycoside hydrolase family 127 protein [Opitutaceae bacterium]|nr:glycoside hydrolase family 127 protein [Opitutaceae bacterium]